MSVDGGGILILREAVETAFTKPLKRAVVRDTRLSWGARGLFNFLWDLPGAWNCYKSHLVQMAPGGRTRLDGLISELQAVGAIRIEPRRLSETEATVAMEAAEIKGSKKKYKPGQLVGWRWIIVHPDTWAIEAPLSTNNTPENQARRGADRNQVSRLSGKSNFEKPAPKVLQLNGSSIKESATAATGMAVEGCLYQVEIRNKDDEAVLKTIQLCAPDEIELAQKRLGPRKGKFPSHVLRELSKFAKALQPINQRRQIGDKLTKGKFGGFEEKDYREGTNPDGSF